MEKISDQEKLLSNATYHEPLQVDTTFEVAYKSEATCRFPPAITKTETDSTIT